MSKHQKALVRLCATPPPADITWDELKGALERLGFRMLANKGSRRKFVHDETKTLIICHQPHPSPVVGKACVAYVAETLRNNGFI